MKLQHLFVYGTLRRDIGNRMYHLLARHGTFVGEGTYQGRLYRIDYYPGVVPSDDPNHQVKGEIYALPEPEFVLPQLDKYEECGPGFPEPTEYIREEKEVILNNGQKLIAWVYVYNHPIGDIEEITSGDFLNMKSIEHMRRL